MPHIASIAFSPPTETPRPANFYHRVPAPSVQLVADRGIEGDRKGKGGDRQLNVMTAERMLELRDEGFKTGPGELGEQITLSGVDVDRLRVGARLQLGSTAIIEITEPRTGCDRFEHIQGKFKGLVRGRLGVMARVVAGGPITVGDPVVVLPDNL